MIPSNFCSLYHTAVMPEIRNNERRVRRISLSIAIYRHAKALKMKKNFFLNTAALALTSQLLRVAGIFFTAWLTRRIGAEGVGLYQLVLTVYFLASTFACSGLGTAVSRLTGEALGASGGKSDGGVLRRAFPAALLLGVLSGAAVYLLADFIGASLLGDARAVPAVRMLAAGLPFMALSSCLQGYFFGMRKALQPSVQMIFEQAVRIGLIMAVLGAFIPHGLSSSCFGIILICMISEALSCALAFALYLIHARRSRQSAPRENGAFYRLVRAALPVALTGYLRAAFKTTENILIPAGLRSGGASEGQALSQYAQIGMALPVLFFPCGVLGAAATLLIPEASEARAAQRAERVKSIFSRVFRMTVLFSLFFSVLFMALGNELGALIYGGAQAGALIAALAPLVPLMYLDVVVDALMTGLNRQMKTLRINLCDYAMRVGLVLLFVPKFGLAAYIGIVYVSTLFNATMSIRCLLAASGARVNYPEWVVKPLLCAAAAGGLTVLLQKLLAFGGGALSVTLQALWLAGAYIVMLLLVRCLTRGDIRWMRRVARSAKKEEAAPEFSDMEKQP
jgi:stage V sporulation protein B